MNNLRFAIFSLLSASFLLTVAGNSYAQDNNTDSNTARLQVRISELEEQMRKMQGNIEQVAYENKQLKTQVEKSNADVEFRINALEKSSAAAASAAPSHEEQAPDSGKLRPVEVPENHGSNQDTNTASVPKFASSRDNYNYAFKLLNQTKYQESGAAFAAFTKSYPKDPLIGNAYYWLGETYYVRRDYVKAADNFRLGYESMQTGPKAADNLLKLSMSLNALKKDKEACVILKQIVVKFGSSSSSMKLRAEQEMNTIGCNG